MSSEGSEQMLGLLQELSVFKAMDEEYNSGLKSRLETEAHQRRERRRQEITQEMQTLAAQSKNSLS